MAVNPITCFQVLDADGTQSVLCTCTSCSSPVPPIRTLCKAHGYSWPMPCQCCTLSIQQNSSANHYGIFLIIVPHCTVWCLRNLLASSTSSCINMCKMRGSITFSPVLWCCNMFVLSLNLCKGKFPLKDRTTRVGTKVLDRLMWSSLRTVSSF